MYALAAGSLPDRVRARGVALRVLPIGPIAAIVGAPGEEVPIESALRRQHAIVLALARQIDPLLPARFGSRIEISRLEGLVRASTDVVLKALEQVRGCQQMTVRLVGRPEAPHEPRRPGTSGTAYLAQRRAAMQEFPEEARPLDEALRRFVVDTRAQPGRGAIRATLFHLVRRDDVGRYRIAFESAKTAISPLRAVLTGPWPVFAFAPELKA